MSWREFGAVLYGGRRFEEENTLVSWDRVSMSKEKGGLGIRKLKDMNESLLMKW